MAGIAQIASWPEEATCLFGLPMARFLGTLPLSVRLDRADDRARRRLLIGHFVDEEPVSTSSKADQPGSGHATRNREIISRKGGGMKYLIDDQLCQDLEAILQSIASHNTPNPEAAAKLLHRLLAAVRDSARRFTQLQSEIASLHHEIASLHRDDAVADRRRAVS